MFWCVKEMVESGVEGTFGDLVETRHDSCFLIIDEGGLVIKSAMWMFTIT